MKNLSWLCCLLCMEMCSSITNGQSWFTRLDATPFEEFFNDMIIAPDGGILIAGVSEDKPNSTGSGTKDIIVIKLDPDGHQQWKRVLDFKSGNKSYSDILPQLINGEDGNIIVVGASHPNTNAVDGLLVFWKLSPSGQLISYVQSLPQILSEAVLTKDKKIVTAGDIVHCNNFFSCEEFGSLYSFDSLYQNTFDFEFRENYYDYHETFGLAIADESAYSVFGQSYYFDEAGDHWNSKCYLTTVNPETYWSTTHLIDYQPDIFFNGAICKVNQNEILLGYSSNNAPFTIKKINATTAATIWTNKIYEELGFNVSINTTKEGHYILASEKGDSVLFMKLDSVGDWIWKKILPVLTPLNPGSPHPNYISSGKMGVLQTPDGGYVAAGTRIMDYATDKNELYVLKVDANGDLGEWVEGHVKKDLNGDCITGLSEPPLAGWILEAKSQSSTFYATTDSSGDFGIRLPLGNYDLRFFNTDPGYWSLCPTTSHVQLANVLDTIRVDQPVRTLLNCPLMDVKVGIGYINVCETNYYQIEYANYGTSGADTAHIRMKLNPYMHLESASYPYTQTGPIIDFYLGDILPGHHGTIQAGITLDCNAPLHYEHCLEVNITPATTCDPNQENGFHFSSSTCLMAGRPFDPNDKIVVPYGIGEFHEISKDTLLTYTIRFQNTGTDTAINVIVRDTLSDLVDVNSFLPGVASHPYTWQYNGEGILKFTFNNIHLPDSVVNPEASHGFVSFQIKPKVNILPYTRISNQASIYFDYQPAILTNTIFNTIDKPVHHGQQSMLICYGDKFDGITIHNDTLLVDTISLLHYDSVITTDLSVLPLLTGELSDDFCEGTTYIFGTQELSNEGVYQEIFTASNGCDSMVTLYLNQLDTSYTKLYYDLCAGDISPVSGIVYNIPGSFAEYIYTVNLLGCDSTIEAHLQVHDSDTIYLEKEVPYGTLYHEILITGDTVFVTYDTSAYGCQVTTFESILVNSTGVKFAGEEAGFSIFPNPFRNEFYISFSNNHPAKGEINLYSFPGGKLIWHTDITKDQSALRRFKVSQQNLPAGIYLVELKIGNKIYHQNVVKF